MLSGLLSFVILVLFLILLGLELTPMPFAGCLCVFLSFSSIPYSFHFVLGLKLTPLPFAGYFSVLFFSFFQYARLSILFWDWNAHPHAFRRLLQCVPYMLVLRIRLVFRFHFPP